MKCPKCNTELPDNAKFCGGCGARLDAPAEQTVYAGAPSSPYPQAPANQNPPQKPKKKKAIILLPICALLVIGIIFITGNSNSGNSSVSAEELAQAKDNYLPPAQVHDIDVTVSDPSDDEISFTFDNKDRISSCSYEVNDKEYKQDYAYNDDDRELVITTYYKTAVVDTTTFNYDEIPKQPQKSDSDRAYFAVYNGYYISDSILTNDALDIKLQELIDSNGLASVKEETVNTKQSSDAEWKKSEGVVSSLKTDLDADGEDEMLVVLAEPPQNKYTGHILTVEAYESRPSGVELSGVVSLDQTNNCLEKFTDLFLYEIDGVKYVFCEWYSYYTVNDTGTIQYEILDYSSGELQCIREVQYDDYDYDKTIWKEITWKNGIERTRILREVDQVTGKGEVVIGDYKDSKNPPLDYFKDFGLPSTDKTIPLTDSPRFFSVKGSVKIFEYMSQFKDGNYIDLEVKATDYTGLRSPDDGTAPAETEPETEEETKSVAGELFSQLPDQLTFSSGAGAWRTTLDIHDDGSFDGSFTDSDMGTTGDGYPHGTRYQSDFTGKFDHVKKINDYTYSMEKTDLNYKKEPGKEEIVDEVRIIYSEAVGLKKAKTVYIYTPDTPKSELPEMFMNIVPPYLMQNDSDKLGFYGLYSEEDQSVFFS